MMKIKLNLINKKYKMIIILKSKQGINEEQEPGEVNNIINNKVNAEKQNSEQLNQNANVEEKRAEKNK